MTAETDLRDYMTENLPNDAVVAIVFGRYGHGFDYEQDRERTPQPYPPVGKILSLDEARPFLQSWAFVGGFGSAACYPVWIWTTTAVLFVHEYDGSTGLAHVPRAPSEGIPGLNGGVS